MDTLDNFNDNVHVSNIPPEILFPIKDKFVTQRKKRGNLVNEPSENQLAPNIKIVPGKESYSEIASKKQESKLKIFSDSIAKNIAMPEFNKSLVVGKLNWRHFLVLQLIA